ncbi:hypothetical protein K474DRAFT_621098 [Panus rudis PR-1116 ss-1]|nr:hypothetical protein K474DRAFT_621098 [Panus rudis PR-1116 ss-1]
MHPILLRTTMAPLVLGSSVRESWYSEYFVSSLRYPFVNTYYIQPIWATVILLPAYNIANGKRLGYMPYKNRNRFLESMDVLSIPTAYRTTAIRPGNGLHTLQWHNVRQKNTSPYLGCRIYFGHGGGLEVTSGHHIRTGRMGL